MKRILILLLSSIMIVGLFTACNSKTLVDEDVPEPSIIENEEAITEKDEVASEEETKTLVDELGRTVEIPENPEKVLGLTSAVMEALFNVGVTPVGKVEEYKIRDEGIALPSVGMTKSLNIEKIFELEPDFIIASSRYHAAVQNELELAGCPIYFFDPDATGEVSIVDLTPFVGDLLGKPDAGKEYKSEILKIAEGLEKQISEIGGYETGMIIRTGDTITSAQRSSGYGALLILLGIENIIPDDLPNASKSPYVSYDVEQIIKDNPDLIFVIAPGKDPDANKSILADIKSDAKWSQLNAIKNDDIFMLPFAVNPNRMNVEDMLNVTSKLIINKK